MIPSTIVELDEEEPESQNGSMISINLAKSGPHQEAQRPIPRRVHKTHDVVHFDENASDRSHVGSYTSESSRNNHWDVTSLALEAKALTEIAEQKVKQRKGLFAWFKKWMKKFKRRDEHGIFTSFIPKVQNTVEEIQQWLQTISERKYISLQESEIIIKDLYELVGQRQSRIDFFDDLLNEYRVLLHLLSMKASEIRCIVSFNEEIVALLKSKKPKVTLNISDSEDTNIQLSKQTEISPHILETAPSTWTGYKAMDNGTQVSPAAFRQALRNYVPAAIYSPILPRRRASPPLEKSPNGTYPANPVPKKPASDRPGFSKSASLPNLGGKSASEVMREVSDMESAKDAERRADESMAEDTDHVELFSALDEYKKVHF